MNEEVKNNKLTIILVVVLFTSPLFLSWYVFNYTNFLDMRGMSNKGDLIDPPRLLDNLALIDPFNDERKETLYGKWNLVYIGSSCDKLCMDNVYLMRQTHLSMDKHSLRVQKVLLLTEQPAGQLKGLLTNYKGQQVIDTTFIDKHVLLEKFRLNDTDNPLKANRIYIVDPLGYLMMSYQSETNPRDIYKDLKKLLRSSRIG